MTQVVANFVEENTGQGFDIHADHVIISQNLINDTLIGMKAMHGSRNVLILGNQFTRSAALEYRPDARLLPHARAPRGRRRGGKAVGANVDGGSIVANNIISDFGYGHYEALGLGRARQGVSGGFPMRFDHGQLPDNPPLSDVVVQGNFSSTTTGATARPRGRCARDRPSPLQVRGSRREGEQRRPRATALLPSNLLHPGTQGVSNVELLP